MTYHDYDDEKIILLQDTFNKTDSAIEAGLIATPLSWSGESAMILINGKGGGNSNNSFCNASLSTIHVRPNQTYRLRFIGATALTFASVMIEGHNMTVIEADGSYTKPYDTTFLQIGSGQRYSVLIRTKSNPSTSKFAIQVESRERPALTRSYAILSYGTKLSRKFYPPLNSTLTLLNTTLGFLDHVLEPLCDNDFPHASEVTRRVTITVHQRVDGSTTWIENLLPWQETFPTEPYLVSLCKNDSFEFPSYSRAIENVGVDPVTRVFPAMIGEVVEIVIQNTASDTGGLDAHPWHAHGSHYYDIGSGNGTYNATANEELLKGRKPVLRDTTMLYRYALSSTNGTGIGWRAWRLRVTQPGVWMIHCHTIQHMIMGMQTVWLMGNETELLSRVPRPQVEGYLTYGGNVYGNKSHSPTVVHFQDLQGESQKV